MKKKILALPSAKRLREIFTYDRTTGELRWRDRPELRPNVNARLRGKIAGSASKDGYVIVGVDDGKYRAHRVIWAIVYGEDPGDWIDHKDRNGLNNAIKNLRKCTFTQNHGNSGVPTTNTSGFKGVSFRRGRFRAVIRYNYKHYDIGTFRVAEDAAMAYDAAAIKYFGKFALLNFPKARCA